MAAACWHHHLPVSFSLLVVISLVDFDLKLWGWQYYFCPCALWLVQEGQWTLTAVGGKLDIPEIQINKKWSNQNLLGDYVNNVEGEHRSWHHQVNPAIGGWARITFCAVHNTRVTLIIQVWAYVKLEIKRKGYETITSHMKLSVFLQLHFEPNPLKFLE